MKALQDYDADIPPGSPSQDNTDRSPRDQLLRRHGYTIHARPKSGVVIWRKGDAIHTQAEALRLCGEELRELENAPVMKSKDVRSARKSST